MPSKKRYDSEIEAKLINTLTTAEAKLKKERARISEEIGSYPSPIPACDAHFNYLLEERSKISKALPLIETFLHQLHSNNMDILSIESLISKLKKINALPLLEKTARETTEEFAVLRQLLE